eukprot:gene10919-3293_t
MEASTEQCTTGAVEISVLYTRVALTDIFRESVSKEKSEQRMRTEDWEQFMSTIEQRLEELQTLLPEPAVVDDLLLAKKLREEEYAERRAGLMESMKSAPSGRRDEEADADDILFPDTFTDEDIYLPDSVIEMTNS